MVNDSCQKASIIRKCFPSKNDVYYIEDSNPGENQAEGLSEQEVLV